MKPNAIPQTYREFYQWEEASRDTIDVKRCYIDLAGDLVSGILLSQIIFWFLPSRDKTKLRVSREGLMWLAKDRKDWWEECRITPKQFDRAIGVLKDKGFVRTERFKFAGRPLIHITLNIDAILQGVKSILTKGENPNPPKVEIHIDERGKSTSPKGENHIQRPQTEITTETTTENTPVGDGKPSTLKEPSSVLMVMDNVKSYLQQKLGDNGKDPIPSYGKEGKAIKRMLDRGFTEQEILNTWRAKVDGRNCYVSMVYVNEDIGKPVRGNGSRASPTDDPGKYERQKFAHRFTR